MTFFPVCISCYVFEIVLLKLLTIFLLRKDLSRGVEATLIFSGCAIRFLSLHLHGHGMTVSAGIATSYSAVESFDVLMGVHLSA